MTAMAIIAGGRPNVAVRKETARAPRMSAPGPNGDFAATALPHLDAAFNLARWLMRDRVEAEDVVQDAMVRALSYFASYQGGDARAWLLSIVRNTAYTRLGARQKQASRLAIEGDDEEDDGLLASIPDGGDDPEVSLSRRQDEALLRGWLDALPLELRECVVLCDLEALSYKEIAQVAGVPIGTVMSRLWRGRRLLMRMAKEDRS